MIIGQRVAEAAASLLGTPFRLHGRNPDLGLDCVGLVDACLKSVGAKPSLPRGYRLRNSSIKHWLSCATKSGLRLANGRELPGDIGLLQASPIQHHLMIVEAPGVYIHAHASLKKVVRETSPLPHNFSSKWRIAADI